MGDLKRYVLGFMFSEGGSQVALIRKTKPEWQAGKWNGIGGKIEQGEALRTAMIREFEEETGVRHLDWKLFGDMGGKDWLVYCFVAKGDLSKLNTMTDEKVASFDKEGIPGNAIINLRWLVPMAWYHQFEEEMTMSLNYPTQP